MSRKVWVYIAGPISKGHYGRNVHEGIRVNHDLISIGFVPICPHLSALADMVIPTDYEAWLALDFAYIERCDVLLRMPGDSPGADREIVHATALGIPVVYSIRELLNRFPIQST